MSIDVPYQQRNTSDHLEALLLPAIAAKGANFGNVQIFDSAHGVRGIVARPGFGSEFLKQFETVSCDEDSACGAVLRSRSRVIVENVATDPIFQGKYSR